MKQFMQLVVYGNLVAHEAVHAAHLYAHTRTLMVGVHIGKELKISKKGKVCFIQRFSGTIIYFFSYSPFHL